MKATILSSVFLGAFLFFGRIEAQPVQVVSSDFGDVRQPQISIASNASVFVVFGKEDSVFCVRSVDYGKTFSKPQLVGSLEKLALGMRRGPRIVATGKGIVVTAISSADGYLYFWRSDDDGLSWSEAARINDVAGAAREGLHAMASDGRGKVFVAWLDLRKESTELWGSFSEDGGKKWRSDSLIYRSPGGHICECCHPSVIFTRENGVAVMWRNWLNGSRDMYLAFSADGKKFTDAAKLGKGEWRLNGCPMDGGSLALGLDAQIISFWRRENSIFTTASPSDSERLLVSRGVQPVAVAGNEKLYFVWQEKQKLFSQTEPGSAATELAAEGSFPSIASAGLDRPPIVVWESSVNGRQTILSQVLK